MNREAKICPDCGAPIPVNAPQGLCPKCLMSGAAAPTEAGTSADPGSDLPAPSVEELARAFPQLEIIGLIGRGGMGYVYRARQLKLERDVALKILPRHLAAQPGFAERFAREGKLLAKLNHPNIVTVHDFGSAQPLETPSPIPQTPDAGSKTQDTRPQTQDPIPQPPYYYLLMEFVDGVNLRQAMRASRFTPAQALSIVPAICEALQFAHDEGVLHRDIKPENILIDAKGRVKIADFGIAKLMERGSASRSTTGTEAALKAAGTLPADEAAARHRPALRELTAASSTLGTPQYMAPEQLERPAEVDHRADIYSLGVVFYELLTGELPVGKFAAPSAKTPLDERVDEIVLRALAKEREQRQQSARELKTEVETVLTGTAAAQAESAGVDDWRSKVPFQSPEVREIYRHLTPEERRADLRHQAWPLVFSLALFLGLMIALELIPRDWRLLQLILLPVFLVLQLALLVVSIERAKAFLCSTEWAKARGIRPQQLRAFVWPARKPGSGVNTDRRFLAKLAFASLLAGTLGTLVLMTLSPRHELALIFAGCSLVLALVCGLKGWRERLGKAVALATLAIMAGAGLTVGVLSEVIPFPWRSAELENARALRAEMEQRAMATAQAAAEQVEQARANEVAANLEAQSRQPATEVADVDATSSTPSTNSPRRFVRLVAGPNGLTFQGTATTWQQLPKLLEAVPSREHTVLEFATSTDEFTVAQVNELRGRAEILGRQAGFHYLSQIGVHPLGTSGTAVTPRAVVDEWLSHVKAGRTEAMWNLTTRESGGAGSIDLRDTWAFDEIKAYTLAHNDSMAMVVTTLYKDNAGRERRIVFSLVKRDGSWLIRENAVATPEGAESRLEGFTAHPNVKYDVRPTDVAGRWTQAFFSPATFQFDADGRYSVNYRNVGGSRTNRNGRWSLEDDRLSYTTDAGTLAGRVVRVREDFFQLEHADGSRSGFQRIENTEADESGRVYGFAPVVDLTVPLAANTRRYLNLDDGELHTSASDTRPVIIFAQDSRGQVAIEFRGIHNVRLDHAEGIRQWDQKTAQELAKEYREAGFALVPSDSTGINPVHPGGLPLTFLLFGRGLLQVTEMVVGADTELKVRYKLVPGATNTTPESALTVDSLAPVVVETEPPSGAREVPPGVTEIRVRFSKPMMDQSWSWVEVWPGSTPERVKEPQFDPSGRTCSLTAELAPGRTYAWWLNSERFTNFKDTNGNPAVPYLLILQTRATPATP